MSNTKIAPAPPIIRSKVKRRRKRTLSIDAQIRAQAKQIYAAGMAEAYKGAALALVGQKLDEIRTILVTAGVGIPGAYQANQFAAQRAQLAGVAGQTPVPAPVENPCVQCGRTGVRKTRPNAFNRTGSWYCAAHQALAGQADAEDRIDNAILGPAKAIAKPRPVVIQTHPVEMRPQEQAPEQPAQEAPPDQLKEALASLGVN